MKRLLSNLLLLLCAVAMYAGKSSGDLARMQRYDTLHQIFDSPLATFGISDITTALPVDAWDFDWFAGYIVQEFQDSPKRVFTGCLRDDSSRSLDLKIGGSGQTVFPFPADALRISFNGSVNDDDRNLLLTYRIPVTRENQQSVYRQCLDMLGDMKSVDSGSALSFEGPYGHVYTLDKEDGSILFSCRMTIPAYIWYSIPAGYTPEISFTDLPDKAPCNSEKESFSEFLNKFNKDAAFRIERRANSDRANYADRANGFTVGIQYGFNELVLTALGECGLLPLHGHYTHEEYKTAAGEVEEKESCGQWFYPTSSSVIYSGWNTDSGDRSSDCSIIILFERIDGEWNTTATYYSGARLDNIINRLMQSL